MKQSFIKNLLQINTNPENRKMLTSLLLDDEKLLEQTVELIFSPTKVSPKAARALELITHIEPKKILPHLDSLITASKNTKNDATVRPLAKIFELMATKHFNKKTALPLSEEHLKQITEVCFEWMITPQKIAPQAYSMQTLFLLGHKFSWVYPELKLLLEKNFHKGSAGYKARARRIISLITQV